MGVLLIVKPVTLPHNSNEAAPKPLNRVLRNAIIVSSLALSGTSCGKTHDPCASPSVYSEGLSRKERIALSRQWIQTCKPEEKVRERFGERGVDILGAVTMEWNRGKSPQELIRNLIREQPDSLEVITFLEENQFIPSGGVGEGLARKMAQYSGEERRRHENRSLEDKVDEMRYNNRCGRIETMEDCAYLEKTDASGRKVWDVNKAWWEKKDEVLGKFGRQGKLVYELWFYQTFSRYPEYLDSAKRELQNLIDTKPKETLEILAFLEEKGLIPKEDWGRKYQAYVDEKAQEIRYWNIGVTVAYVLGSMLVLGSGAYLGCKIRKKRKEKAAFERARQAMMQTYQPSAQSRPLAEEPKKEAGADLDTTKSEGEDMEKKLEEEFEREVGTYRAKISDLLERLRNTTTVAQLLRLDVEWQNLLSELFSRSRDHYECSPRGEGYLERGLGAPLREEILLMEEAIDDAAYRISGKFDMEDISSGEDEEYYRITKLQEKICEEVGSDRLKDDLDTGGKRETEFAEDVEFYRPKIEDFRKRIGNAKTVEELLRLDEEYHNLIHAMHLKSSIYYWSNRDHKGYPRRSLAQALQREIKSVARALNYAAHKITGKRDFEDLLFGEGSEEVRKLSGKIREEMASAECKRELARYRKRKMEKAKKEEDMQPGA